MAAKQEFASRFAKHKDELEWLFMELYNIYVFWSQNTYHIRATVFTSRFPFQSACDCFCILPCFFDHIQVIVIDILKQAQYLMPARSFGFHNLLLTDLLDLLAAFLIALNLLPLHNSHSLQFFTNRFQPLFIRCLVWSELLVISCSVVIDSIIFTHQAHIICADKSRILFR